MRKKTAYKFVYEDGKLKVLHGIILNEDEFTFRIQRLDSDQVIVIGKRTIIKVSPAEGGDFFEREGNA